MGTINSSQRDSLQDEDTVTEPSAGQDEAQESSDEDKLLHKNGHISSLNGQTESQADESNGPCEERVPAEAGSGFVTLKEDDTETTEDLQEGDDSQANTEELDREMFNAYGVMAKEDSEVDKKQTYIEVGFTKLFRFAEFKLTLKKDKCDKTDVEEPNTNEQDKNAATSSEDSRGTMEDNHVIFNEQEAGVIKKDIKRSNVQTEQTDGNICPETDNKVVSEIQEQNEEILLIQGQMEDMTQSPEPDEPLSPFKRFFTQGILASFRKKRKEVEEKEERVEESKSVNKQDGESLDEAAQKDSTCVCLEFSNTTHEESKDLQTIGRDGNMSAAKEELLDPQEQNKVQASPLKRLFRKLSTRRQREIKPTETNLSEHRENLNEKLLSSTEFIKIHGEDEANMAEQKNADEDQIIDISPEESKKKSDSSVSWESLICIGSNKKRARKTSDSEDTTQEKGEDARKTTESPLGSSTEGDYEHLTSSNEHTGSQAEEESVSTWKSLKKLVTPKRKGKMEESGSSEQIPSDTEISKDESSCSIKNLIPGRKKRKFDGHQEQTSIDEAGQGTATDNEDDETPVVVPLSEYEIIEPESLKEMRAEIEPEKDMHPIIEEDKPKETIPPEKASYDVRPSVVPISSVYLEDLTEFISKYQQLSDIPEEGFIEESVATQLSSAEWTTQDDTLAEDIVELTADAVTAPEPATEQSNGDETTEMVSAVSQLTESPETSGNVTPVPPDYDQRDADVIIQEVVETICMSPGIMSITTKDKDPEALVVSLSPCVVESALTAETKVLIAHMKAEATSICTGIVSHEIGDAEVVLPSPFVEGISEFSEAVPTELVSEDMTEGSELAELATDDIYEAEVKEIKTVMHESFLPNAHHTSLAESEKENGQAFQMHVDLMESSKKGEVSLVIQEEKVEEYLTEANHSKKELTPIEMAVISAVQGEHLPPEKQVITKNEVPEVEGPLERTLVEPIHEQYAHYTVITDEKEQRLPDVKLSTSDAEQVAVEVAESEAQNLIVSVAHITINEASEIAEDVVTVSEVVETVTHNIVVSEPDTTKYKASEFTEGMSEVLVSAVECPETIEAINVVSPLSDSIKVVAAEVKDEIQIVNVPSLSFLDSHEVQVEVKDTKLGQAKANVEMVLDVATAENVADIYEKIEEIREDITAKLQIEPVTTGESDEQLAKEIVHNIKVENLLDIVVEQLPEENLAVKDVCLSLVTTNESSVVKEPQCVTEGLLDLKKEHIEKHICSVEDNRITKSTVEGLYTESLNEAEKQVENIQVPVVSEQTNLQKEFEKEECLSSTTNNALSEFVTSAMTETQTTHMVAEAVIFGIISEDASEHKERTAKSKTNSEIAKGPKEIIEAVVLLPKIELHVKIEELQTESVSSKANESQATESHLQLYKEDKQVAESTGKVTNSISEVALINDDKTEQYKLGASSNEQSNESCEAEECTITKPEGEDFKLPELSVQCQEETLGENRAIDTTMEVIEVEASLVVDQEPEALVTPATEVTEPILEETKHIQESSELREQKPEKEAEGQTSVLTSAVTEPEEKTLVVTSVVTEFEERPVVTSVVTELAGERPVVKSMVAELEVKTPIVTSAVTEHEEKTPVVTSVVTELEGERPLLTSVVTELEGERPVLTSVVTELEGERPVLTSVVTELEGERPVLTSVVTELEGERSVLTSAVTELEGERPVLTSVVMELEEERPVVTSVVTELAQETPVVKSMVTELEEKTSVVTSVVTELEEETLAVTSVVTKFEERPVVMSVVTELAGERPVVKSMVAELEVKTSIVTSAVTEHEENTPVVTSVVTELEGERPVLTSVVTELEGERPVLTSAVAELEGERPVLTSVVIELEEERPVLTSVVSELGGEGQVLTSVVTELEVETPVLTSAVTELKEERTLLALAVTELEEEKSAFTSAELKERSVVTLVVTELEVKTPRATSAVTEPEERPVMTSVAIDLEEERPVITPVVIDFKEETPVLKSVVTELEEETPELTSAVTELKEERTLLASAATELEEDKSVLTSAELEERPVVTSVVTELEVKTLIMASVATELEERPAVTSMVTELEVKAPRVTSVVTELEERPVMTSVVTDLEEERPVMTSVVIKLKEETPVLKPVVAELKEKRPELKSVVTELKEKRPELKSVVTELKEKRPELKSVVTELQVETPVLLFVATEIQTGSKEEETLVEVSEEKYTKVKTIAEAALEVTESKLENHVATESSIKRVVSETPIPVVKSAHGTEALMETCVEKNVIAQSHVVMSMKEVGSSFLTSTVNEQLKTPVISLRVPKIQLPPAVHSVQEPEVPIEMLEITETKPKIALLDFNTPTTTAPEVTEVKQKTVVTDIEVETPAVTSVLKEPKVMPVKKKEKNPPLVAPVVQTLIMAETYTTVPADEEPTVVQVSVVPTVQALTVEVTVKEAEMPIVAPEVKETQNEASFAVEVEIKSSLTEAEVKVAVAGATEQVTQNPACTAQSKEDSESQTVSRGPKEIVSIANIVEPQPDVEDDVWEDAVDDIRTDESFITKTGVNTK